MPSSEKLSLGKRKEAESLAFLGTPEILRAKYFLSPLAAQARRSEDGTRQQGSLVRPLVTHLQMHRVCMLELALHMTRLQYFIRLQRSACAKSSCRVQAIFGKDGTLLDQKQKYCQVYW